jgi:hypothetical protein
VPGEDGTKTRDVGRPGFNELEKARFIKSTCTARGLRSTLESMAIPCPVKADPLSIAN